MNKYENERKLKSRVKIKDKRTTIEELHEKKVKEIRSITKKSLVLKKKELKNELNERNRKNIIDRLKLEIKDLENEKELYEYLDRVSSVFYKMATKEDEVVGKVVEKNHNFGNLIEIREGSNRGSLLKEFQLLSESYSSLENLPDIIKKRGGHNTTKYNTCETCNELLIFDNVRSEVTCPKCAISKTWMDPDLVQWSDNVEVTKPYSYKRLGYFKDHLYRVQAKECKDIPQSVINKLLVELRSQRISDPEKITPSLIRKYLNKLNLNQYYDNVNSIIRTLSGKKAPVFPKELEQELESLFMKTQKPFEKSKNDIIPGRNNYLSYPYVIRKLLVIISRRKNDDSILQFIEWFPLLKSRSKLQLQEKIWKKITSECDLPFIPSI